MNKPIAAVIAVALALCAGLAWGRPKTLELLVRPTYQGYVGSDCLVPLHVEIRNNGADARGTLRIEGNYYRMDYPVELPKNSDKELTAYIDVRNQYNDCVATLMTTEGSERASFDPSLFISDAPNDILEIGGASGDLGFLATLDRRSGSNGLGWTVAYVSPEEAPDRLAAYGGLKAVVLGAGSERLSDAAIAALKLYVMSQGTLIVPGGVASPIFSDVRWRDAMPVRVGQPHMVKSSAFLAKVSALSNSNEVIPISEPFSVMAVQPLLGTRTLGDPNQTLMVLGHYGLGQIVFLTFDPFAGSIRNWEGRSGLFAKILAQNPRSGQYLQALLPNQSSGTSSYGYPHSADPGNSPFTLDLPHASTIALILIAYVVCVIPINFGVLHKLKRRELAWLTAPVVSVVFAGFLMTQASALYGLQTSMANDVVVVAQQGAPSALASGHSQVFFAKSGSYDLKLQGVDSIRATEVDYGRQDSNLEDLAAVDEGQVRIPAASPHNLEFDEFDYQQLVPNDFMSIAVEGGTATLSAKTRLMNVSIMNELGRLQIAGLGAGQSVQVPIARQQSGALPPGYLSLKYSPDDLFVSMGSLRVSGSIVVVAQAPDLKVGPSAGKQVSGVTHVIFVARRP